MKRTIITILIAVITSIAGYYVGKNDLISKLSMPSLESPNAANRKHSAETIVQINPYGKKTNALGMDASQSMMTRQFFQTQFAIIQSEDTINKAIDDYKLVELLGTDKEALLKKITANLELRQERGTDLISITAFSDIEEKAQQICYAVVSSYDQRRRDNTEATRDEVVQKYKQKIEAQAHRVEDNRDRLYKLSKELGIPYHGINSRPSRATNSSPESTLDDAKRKRDELEILVAAIKGLDDERLITRMLTTNRPEATILKADYTKLSELKLSKSNSLASGLSEKHPKTAALNIAIEKATEQLAESVKLTKEKLNNDLTALNKQLVKLKENQDRTPVISAEDHTQFGIIKDEYEREFQILQSIKSAEFSETIVAGLEIDPLQYHKYCCPPEVIEMMEARKREKK